MGESSLRTFSLFSKDTFICSVCIYISFLQLLQFVLNRITKWDLQSFLFFNPLVLLLACVFHSLLLTQELSFLSFLFVCLFCFVLFFVVVVVACE